MNLNLLNILFGDNKSGVNNVTQLLNNIGNVQGDAKPSFDSLINISKDNLSSPNVAVTNLIPNNNNVINITNNITQNIVTNLPNNNEITNNLNINIEQLSEIYNGLKGAKDSIAKNIDLVKNQPDNQLGKVKDKVQNVEESNIAQSILVNPISSNIEQSSPDKTFTEIVKVFKEISKKIDDLSTGLNIENSESINGLKSTLNIAIENIDDFLQKNFPSVNSSLNKNISSLDGNVLSVAEQLNLDSAGQIVDIEDALNNQEEAIIADIDNITEIASEIVHKAVDIIKEVNIIQDDVKSAQTETILNRNPKDETNIFNNKQEIVANNKPIDISQNEASQNPKALENTKIANLTLDKLANDSLDSKLQNKLEASNNISNNIASQNSKNEGNSQNGQNNQSSNNLNFDIATNTENNKTESGEFIKFQKYVETSSTNLKNITNATAQKSEDVMAQIKFGISNLESENTSKISIQLKPKELGSVDIRMEIGNDGKTKIAIMAENTDTLNLLQKEAGSLKLMLQDSLQTQSTNLSFSFHDQNDQKWKNAIKESFKRNNNDEDENSEETPLAYNEQTLNLLATDGLDIKA